MYEFKYPKISEMSIEDARRSISYLLASLKNRLKEEKSKLSLFEQIKIVNSIDHIENSFNVSINMDNIGESDFDYSIIDKMIDYAKQLKMPLRVFITGSTKYGNESESIKMSFSQTALDNLIELNNYLVDRDEDGLFFMEDVYSPENAWSFEEVITANSQVEAIVEYIKNQEFTPFEASTFIHWYITTQFAYRENEDDPFSPRSLVGVLTSDDIVCVGYASLTKAIIDRLNMPGLECSTFASKITLNSDNEAVEGINKNEPTGHMQNLIIINDQKYDINGRYITDACWDSKSASFPDGKGLASFMYPVEDLLHFKGMEFDQFHPEVDKLYKTLGFLNKKVDPYSLPIISENIDKSKPIEFEKYQKCLYAVFDKMAKAEKDNKPSDEDVKNRVEHVMNVTQAAAYLIFNEKAIGSIAKKANETVLESMNNDKVEELENNTGIEME